MGSRVVIDNEKCETHFIYVYLRRADTPFGESATLKGIFASVFSIGAVYPLTQGERALSRKGVIWAFEVINHRL